MARIDEVVDDNSNGSNRSARDGSGDGPALAAFGPTVPDAEYAAAVVALARFLAADGQSLASHYARPLQDALGAQQQSRTIEALAFLSAAVIVDPAATQELLLGSSSGTTDEAEDEHSDLLARCFDTAAQSEDLHATGVLFAALLSALADFPPARAQLASAAHKELQDWAAEMVEESPSRTALHAGLWLLKLALPSSSSAGPGVPDADLKQSAACKKRASELAPRLFSLAKDSTLAASSGLAVQGGSSPLDRTARAALLAAIETLAYLSILVGGLRSSTYKDKISSDPDLLAALVSLAKRAGSAASQGGSAGTGALKRPIFPSRGSEAASEQGNNASLYAFDPARLPTGSGLHNDTALQFTLASVFENVSAYPLRLSSEQRQVERLRKIAAQKQRQAERKAAGGDGASGYVREEQEEEEDPRAAMERAEARCTRLLDAGVVSGLVALSTSPAAQRSQPQQPSSPPHTPPLLTSIAATLSALTMRQDQRARGRIAQEGGAKALLMLSEREIANYRAAAAQRGAPATGRAGQEAEAGGRGQEAPINTVPLQALARLCISLNPTLLFGSGSGGGGGGGSGAPLAALPALCTLFLHPAAESDPLAHFEAALALTNVASVGPELAERICGFELLGPSRGGGSAEGKGQTVLDALGARIFVEDNRMVRRAYIELLCNLVQCEPAFRLWAGELEDDEPHRRRGAGNGTGGGESGGAQQRLHILAALCAPADAVPPASEKGSAGGESSLPTRLAAAGTLATLCSSPSACARVLSLSKRSLNTLARLVAPVRPRARSTPVVERFTEIHDEEDDDDDDKTAVEHEDRPPPFSSRPSEADRDWEMTDEEEVELLEAEDADLESYRPPTARQQAGTTVAASEAAKAQLAIRGVTVVHCLVQYLGWRKDSVAAGAQSGTGNGNGALLAGVKRLALALEESGVVDALQEGIVSGMAQLKLEQRAAPGAGTDPAEAERIGMSSEVVRLCLESFKAWSALGLASDRQST
ncbi:SWI5-dependent HO expression protein 4 [Tilletia horrida]|nr:SWI5-dependent HO expression protein 4 [Tilletia horrida]